MLFPKVHGVKLKMQSSYNFYNLPKKYGKEDYKNASEFVIKRYSSINGLTSIYRWGAITPVPGISDMDFVFVFDRSKAEPMPLLKRSFLTLNSSLRYLVRHPFLYIDEEFFRDVGYVYPTANFELIYGKSVKIRKLPKQDAYFSKIAMLSDIIIRHYPRDFIEQIANKSINVRDSLLRLNSLKYSIDSLQLFKGGKYHEWREKMKDVADLRKNWFEKKDYNLLVELCKYAVDISMDIIEEFRDFLDGNKIIEINKGTEIEYHGFKNKTLFVKGWNKKMALKQMQNTSFNLKDFCSIMPIELAPQQIEYSKHDGAISRYIKNHLKGKLDNKIKYPEIIKKRALILNSQAELAHKLKHSDFVAFFDFGYRSYAGINNIVLNLARKYRN